MTISKWALLDEIDFFCEGKKMNKVVNIALSTAALLIATGNIANAATPGAYIGGGAGLSGYEQVSDAQMQDDNGFGGRAFVGYNFNRYFGVEGSYSSFFKATYLLNDNQNVAIDYKLNAFSVVAKGYLPLSEDNSTNLYGLVGVAQSYADIDLKYRQTTIARDSDNGIVPVFGVGASYEINKHLTTSVEASLFGNKEADDNHFGIQRAALATLNLAYKF